MSSLVPCPGCDRHVESGETTCPFCQAALAPRQPCVGGCSGPPAARLARAALVAAGAALLGAACQSQSVLAPYGTPPPPHVDAGAQSDRDAGKRTDGPPDSVDAKNEPDGPPDSGEAAK
jgi:hypothetical protein